LFAEPRDRHMGHMRRGLRRVKASFASGGQRRSHPTWAAMRKMAFTAIKITGRGAV